MRLLPLTLLFLCVGCVGAPNAKKPEIIMTTIRHGNECLVTVGEQQFLTERLESAALAAHLHSLKGRNVLLRFDDDTPYRCIGSAVFALQRADVRIRAPQIPSE